MNAAYMAAQVAAAIASNRQEIAENFVAVMLVVWVVGLTLMYASIKEKEDE